jgi:hypothetical protein
LEEKITIGKERRVENPARPGAKPVVKPATVATTFGPSR